jgi:hypothetical protein
MKARNVPKDLGVLATPNASAVKQTSKATKDSEKREMRTEWRGR